MAAIAANEFVTQLMATSTSLTSACSGSGENVTFSELCANSSMGNDTNVNGTMKVPVPWLPTWQLALWGTLTVITSVTTVLGNLVVILSFVIERALRQPTNFFILSLAVSDLLIGLLSMPFYTIYLLAGQHWMLGAILCDLWLSIDYSVCLASIYTVFCITVDRFCSVRIPAKYRNWRTPNKVIVMIAVTWSIPCCVFFITIFGWQYFVGGRTVPDENCYVQYLSEFLFSFLLQIGYFWTTLVVMFVLYALIYKVALTMSRKSEAKQKQANALLSGQNNPKSAAKSKEKFRGDGSNSDQGKAGKKRRISAADSSCDEKHGASGSKRNSSRGSNGRLRKRTMTDERQSSCALASDDFVESEKSVCEPPVVIVSSDNVSLVPSPPIKPNDAENTTKLAVFSSSAANRSRSSSEATSNSSNQKYSSDGPKKTAPKGVTDGDASVRSQQPSGGCQGQITGRSSHNYSYAHDTIVSPTSHVIYAGDTNSGVFKTVSSSRGKIAAFLARLSRSPASSTTASARKTQQVYENNTGLQHSNTGLQHSSRRTPPCCLIDTEYSVHESLALYATDQGSPVWQRRYTHNHRYYRNHNSSQDQLDEEAQWATTNYFSDLHRNGATEATSSEFTPQTPVTPRSVFEARRTGRRRCRSASESSYTASGAAHKSTATAQEVGQTSNTVGGDIDTDDSFQPLSKGAHTNLANPATVQSTTKRLNSSSGSNTGRANLKSLLPKIRFRKNTKKGDGRGGSEEDKKSTTKVSREKSKSEHRALKALRTITIILGAFVLCWTPWQVLSLITGYYGYSECHVAVQRLYDISYWLCYLNSPINPFCYALANQQFKKTFIRIFKLDWHRT